MCLVNYAHVGDLTISFHIMSIFVPAPLILFGFFFLLIKTYCMNGNLWIGVDMPEVKEQPTDG